MNDFSDLFRLGFICGTKKCTAFLTIIDHRFHGRYLCIKAIHFKCKGLNVFFFDVVQFGQLLFHFLHVIKDLSSPVWFEIKVHLGVGLLGGRVLKHHRL